jgi:hypothetical protein
MDGITLAQVGLNLYSNRQAAQERPYAMGLDLNAGYVGL